jgi:hypothetical protein
VDRPCEDGIDHPQNNHFKKMQKKTNPKRKMGVQPQQKNPQLSNKHERESKLGGSNPNQKKCCVFIRTDKTRDKGERRYTVSVI